jgi:hypothetical protein
MSPTKRIAILLVTLALFGTAACSDATGPRPNACTEHQGNGGRC